MRRTDGLALFAVGVALEVVLRPLHGAGSVQHQRLAAIRAEYQSREDVRLVHVLGDTLFVLTHLRLSKWTVLACPFSCVQIYELGKLDCPFEICSILPSTSLIIKFEADIV